MTITTNVANCINDQVTAYRELAQKAWGGNPIGNRDSRVVAALKQFFYNLDFLLKYGHFPSVEDTAQNALSKELRGLKAFFEKTQNVGESYILQQDENTRYRFTWTEAGKVTVAEERAFFSLVGARTEYACVDPWRKGDSQECDLNGVLAILGVPEVFIKNWSLINEKLDSFTQKLTDSSWGISEKGYLFHEMESLKTDFYETLSSLDTNQLNDSEYVDSALERAIFMFSLRQLTRVTSGNITESFCLRINHSLISDEGNKGTKTNPAVFLCDKSTNTPLAKLPLMSVCDNFATLSKLESMERGDASGLAQLLLSFLISSSYRSVAADIYAAVNLGCGDEEAVMAQLRSIYQFEFGVSMNRLRRDYDRPECPIDTQQKDAWKNIHEWFMGIDVREVPQIWASGRDFRVPEHVFKSVFDLLGARWASK